MAQTMIPSGVGHRAPSMYFAPGSQPMLPSSAQRGVATASALHMAPRNAAVASRCVAYPATAVPASVRPVLTAANFGRSQVPAPHTAGSGLTLGRSHASSIPNCAAAGVRATALAGGFARGATDGSAGVVLCLGDSITAGINERRHNYPQILEGMLQSAGYQLHVRNLGIWGESCDKMLGRFPYALADAAQRGRIAFILILGGTNDILQGGFYCSELLKKLTQLHEQAGDAPGSPYVGVLTLPPMQVKSEFKERARLHVNDRLRSVCQDHQKRFLVELESVSLELSYDGLHYNPEGYYEFADRAFQAMLPFLGDRSRA